MLNTLQPLVSQREFQITELPTVTVQHRNIQWGQRVESGNFHTVHDQVTEQNFRLRRYHTHTDFDFLALASVSFDRKIQYHEFEDWFSKHEGSYGKGVVDDLLAVAPQLQHNKQTIIVAPGSHATVEDLDVIPCIAFKFYGTRILTRICTEKEVPLPEHVEFLIVLKP